MKYAFAIDHRKCIGCHACTVACKTEHGVPLGSFRTWVKYTERGTFPHVRRYFNVLRCNHCTYAPCVAICPTRALIKRDDGIVDFDRDACIGCKACMQACPYDAIYIDPETNTAAKCNFCAHRVEVGLAPACVIVCPEQAIVAGDLDDPLSEISRLVHREPTEVRKPEQGTGPNVYYVGADSASLSPTSIARGRAYLWAQTRAEGGEAARPREGAQTRASERARAATRGVASCVMPSEPAPALTRAGTAERGADDGIQESRSAALGGAGGDRAHEPAPARVHAGDARIAGDLRASEHARAAQTAPALAADAQHPRSTPMRGLAPQSADPANALAQITYDVHHPAPWGWKVALYLWTKGVAAGTLLVPCLLAGLGIAADRPALLDRAGPLLALLFNALTVALLVGDLKRPERFHYLLVRGNTGSWLVRGAYVLIVHGILALAWLVLAWRGADAALRALAWPGVLVALATAGYTAFLFGQAEGRDLWQSPLLLWRLVVEAVLAGTSAFVILAVLAGYGGLAAGLAILLLGALGLHLLLFAGEMLSRAPTQEMALAHAMMTHGRYATPFWSAILIGAVLPFVLLCLVRVLEEPTGMLAALSALLVLGGVLAHEVIFVRAGQAVPLS
jgi:Fe-S-cluster-containing dehydrogenase component/formate-dependent nitrite reductase membrane component NrfD